MTETTYDLHPASPEEREMLWKRSISCHPDDDRWKVWRAEYTALNELGIAETWVVTADGVPVGEGTILYEPECSAIEGRTALADGQTRANLNGLRMTAPFEGKGLMSALVKSMEMAARQRGIRVMTIGVDEEERRNRAIYDHWGYKTLLYKARESGERILYLAKEL